MKSTSVEKLNHFFSINVGTAKRNWVTTKLAQFIHQWFRNTNVWYSLLKLPLNFAKRTKKGCFERAWRIQALKSSRRRHGAALPSALTAACNKPARLLAAVAESFPLSRYGNSKIISVLCFHFPPKSTLNMVCLDKLICTREQASLHKHIHTYYI